MNSVRIIFQAVVEGCFREGMLNKQARVLLLEKFVNYAKKN